MVKKMIIAIPILALCMVCIFIPGVLLSQHSLEGLGMKQLVPESMYSAANMSMSRGASEKLTLSEKLSLINGEWESRIYENVDFEMNEEPFRASIKAKNGTDKLYGTGEYKVSLKSDYSNWYSWKTKSCKAVDSIFNTYTVYYWIIEYEKYDHTEKHIVYMLEDGTIFRIEGNIGNEEINYKISEQ